MPQPYIIVVAAATLVLGAAFGGDTTGPANSNGEAMSARIDGEAWSAQSIAGTFEFTMAHEGASPAAREVTSGKFDVRY